MNQYAIYLVGMPVATVFADDYKHEGMRAVFITGGVAVAWFQESSVIGVAMVTPPEENGDSDE